MTSRSSLLRRIVSAASCAAVIAVCLAPQAHANLLGQLDYVALGDSYSAASGVLPPDLAAPLQCLRSIRNYPHVIAGADRRRS